MKIGEEVFTCPSEGIHQVNLNAYTGSVKCPKFNDICVDFKETKCPFDCYGQGYCMSDNTCQCLSGFSGKDCNDGRVKETDPFVTGGNNEKDEKEEEEEEKKEEDERNKKDEEDEKEEEEEEKEEEEEEDKREEEERDREEEQEKSEEAKKAEADIAELQKAQDYYTFHINKYRFFIGVGETCLDYFKDRRSCVRSVKYFEKHKKRAEQFEQIIENRVANLESELENLLTERQKIIRKVTEKEKETERKIIIDQNYMEFLESKLENYTGRRNRYQNIINYFIRLEARTKSQNAKKRYRSLIDRYQTFVNYYNSKIYFIELEMEELFGSGAVRSLEKLKNEDIKI